jgi:hypothetical protein
MELCVINWRRCCRVFFFGDPEENIKRVEEALR